MIRRPQRSDSFQLGTDSQDAMLANLPEELHDMRRVQAYGQEEDLKEALGKMIGRVEQLSAMLNQAQKSQIELETNLKLARSNLQLALANNEMLEDALRRESAIGSKDVGWRRRSDRPDSRQGHHQKELSDGGSRPPSRQGYGSAQTTPTSDVMASPSVPESPIVKPATSPVPDKPQQQDSRFFRFRFGSSSASTSPNPNAGPSRPRTPPASAGAIPGARRPVDVLRERDASHLTSASLPSLVASNNKREDELVAELASVNAKLEKVSKEKSTLEQEVEGLSQALFEEANKMVAQERIKCAEIEEELRQVRQEKEALKSAMRIVEQENERLKSPIPASTSTASLPNASTSYPAIVEDDSTPRGSRPISHVRRRSQGGSISSRGHSSRAASINEEEHVTRPRSTSSTRGFRQKSSSSERGWESSPSHASIPLPDSDASSVVSEKEAGVKSDLSGGVRKGESGETKDANVPEVLLTSPTFPDLPFEDSPWTRL
ncbi:uncharacterized protein FOMMEDRAFT_20443 [Fomitiporia mediterranea MF3/22]|uniref:uncharacterized protein n=1 Tax=Fomitiporia mediterranea (strain MF3/22) TaxID=694068 RepID=UPI0004407AD5|nr:uncharacterized protein FOMMEDRAFT_20443 [Fomitiporia mediterranea MF3/22]EJD03303.1 hypothetical protein FOMMEDRAFT_20443 [Fomitiporia mediterranea MF3/22]